MQPIHELLSRIRWDKEFAVGEFELGYYDRVEKRIERVPLADVVFPEDAPDVFALVNGVLYDVQFKDGTCVALFTGCDQVTDFKFQTSADALAASNALLNTVFLDVAGGAFDTHPSLTFGCEAGENANGCSVFTPYGLNSGQSLDLAIANAINTTVVADASASLANTLSAPDLTDLTNRVFAVWGPAVSAPEPSSLLLLGTGLSALVVLRRRQRR